MDGIATRQSPPFSVPMRYLGTSVAFFVAFHVMLAARPQEVLFGPPLAPAVLATVHLATVGWLSMVVMGAMYQLAPVLLDAELASPRAAGAGYWLALPGAAALAAGLGLGRPALAAAGGVAVAGAGLLFAGNLAVTFRRAGRWSLQGTAMAAAAAFFLTVAAWGTVLALNLWKPFLGGAVWRHMGVHAALGLIGWFSLIIAGVGYRLIPTFVLSHGYPENLQRPVIGLLAAGAPAAALGAFIPARGPGGLPAAAWTALPACAGLALFAWDVARILRHRRRPRLELVTRYSAAAVAMVACGVAVGWPALAGWSPPWLPGEEGRALALRAAAYLALAGWASLMAVGQLFKIIPFLTWLHRYGERMGREQVPLPRDLFDARLGEWSFRLLVPGAAVTAASLILGQPWAAAVSTRLELVGALLFAWAMGQVLRPRER